MFDDLFDGIFLLVWLFIGYIFECGFVGCVLVCGRSYLFCVGGFLFWYFVCFFLFVVCVLIWFVICLWFVDCLGCVVV